jgi:Xaa-Pro dipeptidase
MTAMSRRSFVSMTVGAALAAGGRGFVPMAQAASAGVTASPQPITAVEHAARVAKVQTVMREQHLAALLVESGSSLEYFTGIRWWRSERTTAALIPADGQPIVVTPFFEVPSVRESLKIDAEIQHWNEDESPFALLAGALDALPRPDEPVALEETTRAFIVEGVRKALKTHRQAILGDKVVNACRTIKSPAELALMQVANDITLAAIRHVHANLKTGMTAPEIRDMVYAKMTAQGGKEPFALVLLNDASAYPHGTEKPQSVREGSIILIDTGCKLHGYSSDISRTWVHGKPTARQREVWDTVKRGQELALETVKIGRPVGDVDKAVRAYYEGLGWSKDYGLPGTSHRTGHGIGMDVHEPPNLMRADTTPFQAGMCFSDEPGIYIPGEFGVRMEDCWYLTEQGPKLFTPLAKSIDDPI